MIPYKIPLPIDGALVDIERAVQSNASVIVEAPPGAGKTTRVAPALLASHSRKVVLVQPRRIAARAAAARIAMEVGSAVGELVGYHVRFDKRVGPGLGWWR